MPDTTAHSPSTSVHQIDHPQTIRYLISTAENDLGRVCWEIKDSENRLIFKSFKELTQTEIVETIQDLSGESLWSIHRPIRGWYLALRSSRDPNLHNFITLEPRNVTKGTNRMIEFSFRLKSTAFVPPSPADQPLVGHHKPPNAESSIKRRYPSISSLPRSPSHPSFGAPTGQNEAHHLAAEAFVVRLRPVDEHAQEKSMLRSLTALFVNTNQRVECFVDNSPLPPRNTHGPSRSRSNTGTTEDGRQAAVGPKKPPDRLALFDYEDQNSVFGIQNKGLLTLHPVNSLELLPPDDAHPLGQLGFHQAFWVAVCIAYLGFRADQDAYVAAIQGD